MKVRRKIGLCVCLLLLAIGVFLNQKFEIVAFHPFFGSDDCDLKVLTWNVHAHEGLPEKQQISIAKLIIEQDADIVLLNEINIKNAHLLDSLLKAHFRYTDDSWAQDGCKDIIYSNFQLYKSGHIPIPVQGICVPSICATIPVAGDSVFIIGVHLASNSGDGSAIVNGLDSLKRVDLFYERYKEKQEMRNYSMMWIKRWVKEHNLPTIVMGDMNDFSGSAPLDSLTDIGLKDAWWEGGTGYGCTFHTGWMRLRIDHILYGSLNSSEQLGKVMNGLELTGVKVISTDLSDHNPMVATFRLVRNGNE